MSQANLLWGAPRIHGEFLKLGIEVSQAAVSKYMSHHRKPPSQDWRTLLENHAKEIVSIDLFTAPTATLLVLFVLLILSNHRRRILHFVERVIGSIRPECLDNVIIFSEGHLRRVPRGNLEYYHGTRTHLALEMDCPDPRGIEAPDLGPVLDEQMVGGLHHRYSRRAA